MIKTIWKVSPESPGGRAAGHALSSAGIDMVEMDWDEAQRALQSGAAELVVADFAALSARNRSLSHDLRTPLTAMAGWLHLIETGSLDEAATRRAFEKLRRNIDDQVRTIERHLGDSPERQR
ncbi:MAG: histidine kinase dimerization/phospho-acceptor domain-containing protein [Usitatibacter sp.]